jgi:hypothetical protein
VNEVKLNDGSQPTTNAESPAAAGGVVVVVDTEDNDDKDWVSLDEAGGNLGLPYDTNQPQTISEQIAQVSVGSALTPAISHRSPRNSLYRTSQKRQRRSHRLRSTGFVLHYRGYTWP